nr:MAG TPA: hypothetical protein [Caudoviricetes sp.]
MNTDEMIEVMQAYTRGEAIEVSDKGANDWSEIKHPLWDWANFEYRVKPKKPGFKDTNLMIWKLSEAEPLHPRNDFYQSSYIKERDDKDVNNYVYFDDVLWYWEFKMSDGWHISQTRMTRAQAQAFVGQSVEIAPLYALGFRIKDENE